MRKTITALLLGALVAATLSATAQAKPVGGSYDETLLPFPKLAAWGDPAGIVEPSCLAGQSGVTGTRTTSLRPATARSWRR